MSGESPRVQKIEEADAGDSAGTANKARMVGDAVAPTLETQRSRQQLMTCWPLGQHEPCGTSEFAIAVAGQSADINGEVEANVAIDPCRPIAIIRIRAMSSRFTTQSIAVMMTERKPSGVAG